MSLSSLVKDLVAVADSLTGDLQASVTHHAFSGATVDSYGKVTNWGAGVARKAVVEASSRLIRTAGGDTLQARAKLTFPRPVTVDARDKIVLPDTSTGPILDVTGVTNPTTNQVYASEVWLG
jgi:hypothetical protein